MMKKIRKSLKFLILLIVFILFSTLILPSLLFADTTTFDAIGDSNYPGVNLTMGAEALYHFDVTGIKLNNISSATLKVEAHDVNYNSGEIDEVYFNNNYVGHLVDGYADGTFTYLNIEPSLIVDGENNVKIIGDANLQRWNSSITSSTLKIETGKRKAAVEEEKVWVRDVDMTCYQVWINEDNNFEFVFRYEYKNNNWVKIYDMAGNEVFSIDMPYGKANFEATLPDGMYTVKTFHDDMSTPLQEFIIGKP